jgi:hypothetical protein
MLNFTSKYLDLSPLFLKVTVANEKHLYSI